MNHKKLRRLYAEERLQVRRRSGRKRALGTRAPMTLPQGPDQRWSLDFVSDMLTDGRRFRILAVVDDFTRECLCLVADTSLSGARVARGLTLLIARRERASAAVRQRQWHGADKHGDPELEPGTRIGWHYIGPPPERWTPHGKLPGERGDQWRRRSGDHSRTSSNGRRCHC